MSRTLLLADDSVTIQKVVGLSFANEDIRLVTVDNGDDAIARAKEITPDVVLADVVMPGKNGYEVCEAIKNDPALRHVPVLLLTGTFEAFDEERARRARADGHITKPFEAQSLVDQVNRLLAAAAPPAASPNDVTSFAGAVPVQAAAADDGADFFDEALSEAPLEDDAPALAPAAFDLDAGDDDLAFAMTEDEEPVVAASTTAASTTAAPTVAILEPEPAAAWNGSPDTDPLLDGGEIASLELETPEIPGARPGVEGEAIFDAEADDLGVSARLEREAEIDDLPIATGVSAEPALAEEPFDFDFDGEGESPLAANVAGEDPLARLDADDLAREAVVDPEGGRGYDVSWSDLGAPLAAEPVAAPAALPTPTAAPSPAPATFAFAASPVLESAPSLTAPAPRSPAPEPAPVAPAAAAPIAAAPVPPTAAPLSSVASAPAAATPHAAAIPDLTPLLRERLHDTLEKIAWEAFSDLSDTIVRQVLQRVETIAWEVIPQMAETLVREEIRRMKGETD